MEEESDLAIDLSIFVYCFSINNVAFKVKWYLMLIFMNLLNRLCYLLLITYQTMLISAMVHFDCINLYSSTKMLPRNLLGIDGSQKLAYSLQWKVQFLSQCTPVILAEREGDYALEGSLHFIVWGCIARPFTHSSKLYFFFDDYFPKLELSISRLGKGLSN